MADNITTFKQSQTKTAHSPDGEDYSYSVTKKLSFGPLNDKFSIQAEYNGEYVARGSYLLNLDEAKKLRKALDEFMKNVES